MTRIRGASIRMDAGHIVTLRDHSCGQFEDTFDWLSLPVPYQVRVGVSRYAK